MQQPARRTASAFAITLLCCTGLTMTLEGCASNSAPAAETPTAVQAPPRPEPSGAETPHG